MEENEITSKNQVVRNALGQVISGTPNPNGRPKESDEKKAMRKTQKELIAEYKASLIEALPMIRPALLAKAAEGDVPAIKEVHDRAMDKAKQQTDVTSNGGTIQPILVEIINAKPTDNTNT